MIDLLNKIKATFFAPELSEEAIEAYYNKLPNGISVLWERDDKYIIGEVTVDAVKDDHFITQAVSAEEFVDMVNDGLLAFYDIPKKYFLPLANRRFVPNKKQFARLNDVAIKRSFINFEKVLALN